MEGLLILIGIWVLDIVIKKVAANRREQQQLPPQYQPDDDELDESEEQAQGYNSPRSLQDLIRQFENAQQQAAQGNIEPATPPVKKRRIIQSKEAVSLRYIAEVVIQVDFINLEFLMEEFDVDENTAAEMLMALQAHRIVGRDMGEGTCDVLVHDMEELDNLLLHEKRAEQERESAAREHHEAEMDELRRKELERQRELNALEERAKSARESAAAFMGNDVVSGTEQAPRRAPLVSTKNLTDVRKGFIWAKVLDEPRFKRRWSAQYR